MRDNRKSSCLRKLAPKLAIKSYSYMIARPPNRADSPVCAAIFSTSIRKQYKFTKVDLCMPRQILGHICKAVVQSSRRRKKELVEEGKK